ncbi:DUF1840 domain-containing protein [Comamonadaceae bacterium OH2545_COT-014]|nr:DUF1840 domain-containing protein [Comamonadaceae bacterium OH2545_COT-014]
MLYKFKSQAAADVIMLQANAEELLKIIGKTPGATGIITVAQIPAAIAALQAAVAARESGDAEPPADAQDEAASASGDGEEPISLRRRAAPFIDLLQQSASEGKDVVWGV